VGLNPLTKPFDYIVLNGKLTLYAKKDATDQLRDLKSISITELERAMIPGADVLTVTAHGRTKDGRTDASIGAVSIKGLAGEALANAMMKAETKAKRRLTLSLAGLGWLDESEVGSIPGAQLVAVGPDGEIDPVSVTSTAPATLAEALARREPPAAVSPEPTDSPPSAAPVVEAPVAAPAPESAPVAAPEDTVEAESREEAQDANEDAPLVFTPEEFKSALKERHILSGSVVAVLNSLFPGRALNTLLDTERGTLYLALVAQYG